MSTMSGPTPRSTPCASSTPLATSSTPSKSASTIRISPLRPHPNSLRAAGPNYTSITWEEQNRQLFSAFKLERAVTALTIGLIVLVGALNIFITLTMIVLTKYKDIAVLMSMGARRRQIRRIFVVQGAMIAVIGITVGLVVGYTFCYFAGTYHLIPLDASVYALSYLPFDPNPWDGLWITLVALGVSLLATVYPARNATSNHTG